MYSVLAFVPTFAVNVVLGLPAYFILFVFSYYDGDGPENHIVFLTLIAIFACVCGLVQVFVPSRADPSLGRRMKFGVLASLALNSAVVGVGSIVSSANKDQNSVSVHFSTTTDVLVPTGLFLAAVGFAVMARRLSPYIRTRSRRN
ncbi:MAG: hypothetical protein JWP74_3492 [Marmoricola sp.]|nr:hypothetical protein [Marmoricola sp.]